VGHEGTRLREPHPSLRWLFHVIHRGGDALGCVSKAIIASIDATISEIPMTALRGTTGVSCRIGKREWGVAQRYKGMSVDGAPVPSSHPDRVGNVSDATAIPANRTMPASVRRTARRRTSIPYAGNRSAPSAAYVRVAFAREAQT
jgi:hypothetical protein